MRMAPVVSSRDQALALIVMLLVLLLCVGLTHIITVHTDSSCDERTFIEGVPHVCQYAERDTLYCYPKECDR